MQKNSSYIEIEYSKQTSALRQASEESACFLFNSSAAIKTWKRIYFS